MSKRRVPPDKMAAALGGPDPGRWGNVKAAETGYLPCSRCEQESATVPLDGGLCLRCRLGIPAPFSAE